jgi:hypothetical protein
VVDDANAIFTVVVFGVAAFLVLAELFAPFLGAVPLKAADEIPVMVRVLEVTVFTVPLANPVFEVVGRPAPPPGPPAGASPEPPAAAAGRVPPEGGVPPPKRPPPPPAPPAPPNPPVLQLPAVGWLMVTVLAVSLFDFLATVPVTVTQSPAATEEAATDTVSEKVVDVLQLTVTWPDCSLWTSMDDPVMAATEPEAPGNDPAPDFDVDEAAPAAVMVARLRASGRATRAVTTAGMRGARRLMVSPSPGSFA